MLTCHLMGGLGNQLFQIFAAISYAIRSKNEFYFLNVYRLDSKRHTYWNTFLSNLQVRDSNAPNMRTIKQANFEYNDLDVASMNGKNSCIFGYFQSCKFFQDNYGFIYDLLEVKKQSGIVAEKSKHQDFDTTISLHFRLGDYKGIQHVHPLMPCEYYKRALHAILEADPSAKQVLYFCEEEDTMQVLATVEKLRCEFQTIGFARASNELEDWEQMLLMSCCAHNVIANSSFSWWGAYFNPSANKVVCYPSVWFGPALSNPATHDYHCTRDLCPDSWRRISATIP